MIKKIFIGIVIAFVVIGGFITYASQTSSTVVVEHTLNAPVEKVWSLWMDPESIKQWWSPKHYSAPLVKNDFREGGTYLFSMKAPDGKMSYNVGTYTQISPFKKIYSTMAFADEAGNKVPASHYSLPGVWPDEVTLMVDFEDANGQTTVKVTEVGIPLIMKFFAKLGWEQQFEKMDRLL